MEKDTDPDPPYLPLIKTQRLDSFEAESDGMASWQHVDQYDSKEAVLLGTRSTSLQLMHEEQTRSRLVEANGGSDAVGERGSWGGCSQSSEPRPKAGQPPSEAPTEAFGPSKQGGQKRRKPGWGDATEQGRLGKPPPVKRTRAKKPEDAPKRPQSAYLFFLSDFRTRFKEEHPEVKQVAQVALAAGAAWRALPAEKREQYEVKSAACKASYAEKIGNYLKDNPRPTRKHAKPDRPASYIPRPMSAYFCFLADFRTDYKERHGPRPVKEVGKAAGEAWNGMSPEQRAPYEERSLQSRQQYHKLKHAADAQPEHPARARVHMELPLDQGSPKSEKGCRATAAPDDIEEEPREESSRSRTPPMTLWPSTPLLGPPHLGRPKAAGFSFPEPR